MTLAAPSTQRRKRAAPHQRDAQRQADQHGDAHGRRDQPEMLERARQKFRRAAASKKLQQAHELTSGIRYDWRRSRIARGASIEGLDERARLGLGGAQKFVAAE